MLGRLAFGVLDLREICRFPNEPCARTARCSGTSCGCGSRSRRSLDTVDGAPIDSVGVDTWGCDYALLGEHGELLGNPYHYRDARTDGVMEAVFAARVAPTRIYDDHRHPVPALQHALSARTPRAASTPRLHRRRDSVRHHPRPAELLADRRAARRIHQRDDDADRRCADAELGAWTCCASSTCRRGCCRRSSSRARCSAALKSDVSPALAGTPVVAPACHDTGSAVASVPAGGGRAFLSSGTWSLLGTEVARAGHHRARARAELHQRRRRLRARRGCSRTSAACGCCRRAAATGRRAGSDFEYAELLAARGRRPAGVPIALRSRRPGVPPPARHGRGDRRLLPADRRSRSRTAPAAFTRAILESLAFKYRVVLDALEELTGARDRPRCRSSAAARATGC